MKNQSFFPILIEWSDTKERVVMDKPDSITSGRSFKVIETNTKEK